MYFTLFPIFCTFLVNMNKSARRKLDFLSCVLYEGKRARKTTLLKVHS